MNQLTIINQNGQLLVDSREVAEMTEKRHDHLIRDIEGYKVILDQTPNLGADQFFIESAYEAGTGKQYKCYLLTRKGCDMVANKMTGEKGVLFTATYVTRFEEMEKQLAAPTDLERFLLNPDTIIRIAQNWKAEQELRIAAEKKIEEDRPKVIFAEALETSRNSILIGELAKLLKQNGVDIGQNRLFERLRIEGYLMRTRDERWNDPTQKALELGLFEIKKRSINNPDGSVRVVKTTKVTGKGQIYFINKYKSELVPA
ncbi:MAG TPA: phage antirepressor KilAC domain-containing protein [Brevibacillus sp.]|nr:phage antirepressor KilAC domain-containing protein [Brevibacillus sp.]